MFFRAGRLGSPTHLLATPATTPREYEHLIGLLREEILPLYPRLELGGYKEESS
jgi:hypothetical protein